ncbi:MAG: glycoside hydrolase family 2 TIM barrel-domain containing protein [Pseudomonadota bacterium]
MTADDPFAHLHDEAYGDAFRTPRLDVSGLIDPGGRPIEPLTGGWRLTLDPFEEGLRQRWFAYDDAPVEVWTTPRDWDPLGGEPVTVPSCWNMVRPEWRHYEGAVWYTRALDHRPDTPGERCFLRVGAANYATSVFLDGCFLGRHAGGSTPFCVELTGALRVGPNRLMLMVDNSRRAERVPMHHVDWFNYGGLYREVGLLRLPEVFVKRAGAALVPGSGRTRLAFDVELSDPVDGQVGVSVPCLELDFMLPVAAGRGRIEVDAAPELWAPDTPKLYDVLWTFGADRFRERIGFREIRVDGERILLNGRPVWLAGACVHEDDVHLGKVSTETDVRRRFRHLKELSANFARLAHYPHHEHVARIADEEGVLLWAEIPVYWAIDFADPETLADARNQLAELIARDRNRASVVVWGVGNENADTDARLAFMSALVEGTRAADPTRLVGAACLIDREHFAIADRLAAVLDVVGLNEYFGWYEPDFDGLERLLANSTPGKPVIVSETGADAVVGRRGEGRALFSEDWQAEVYRRQFALLRKASYVQGLCAWLLYDFRSERRQARLQAGYNRKGLIAADKSTKKLAFAALADLYRTVAKSADP